jgi:hypothetical protein
MKTKAKTAKYGARPTIEIVLTMPVSGPMNMPKTIRNIMSGMPVRSKR